MDVRQWRFAVPAGSKLSLLGGLLGCALFRGTLLCAAGLFRCLLSTFLSCHTSVAPFSDLVFLFHCLPQDTVLTCLLWARVNGAQHLAI